MVLALLAVVAITTSVSQQGVNWLIWLVSGFSTLSPLPLFLSVTLRDVVFGLDKSAVGWLVSWLAAARLHSEGVSQGVGGWGYVTDAVKFP